MLICPGWRKPFSNYVGAGGGGGEWDPGEGFRGIGRGVLVQGKVFFRVKKNGGDC